MKSTIGIVVKVYGLYSTVLSNNQKINCVLRGKIRQNKDLVRYSNPIAVGDYVKFEINADGTGVINSILERNNIFSRKEKGKNKKEDIIATNLDLIIIIQSFRKPKLNLRFVDRLLLRGDKENIPVILCVNKLDLSTNDIIEYINNYYLDAQIDVLMTSAITGEGLDRLSEVTSHKTSLFVGNSGVGKTSILNFLFPGINLRTSDVSESTKKGRHTTANVEMIKLSENTGIIDTPGVREFGLMDIQPHMLGQYFNEFKNYLDGCEFRPCTHYHEPNCEVKRQVELGNIFKDRYISYLNIFHSLKKYYESKYN